jgi:hypothetical protein
MESFDFEISSSIFEKISNIKISDCSIIDEVSEDTFYTDMGEINDSNLTLKKKILSGQSLKDFIGEDQEIRELTFLVNSFINNDKENNDPNCRKEEMKEILSILKKPNRYNSCRNINNKGLIKPIVKPIVTKGRSNLNVNIIERVSNPLFKRYSSN